jgi:cyclopropane fatty-acyl-phospholipid synthase-like methyltransferase
VEIDYNTIAQEYGRHRRAQPLVVEALIRGAPVRADSRVLDVGCGSGNYAIALQEAVGCTCLGVDPSEEMLSKARARSTTVIFSSSSAEHIDCPPDSFDLVFSVDVIHHVVDRRAYMRGAHRALRKAGKICTVTDSEEIIRRRQPLSTYFPETVEPELRRYPRIPQLRALMSEVGFADIREETVRFAYPITDIQIFRDRTLSCLHLISPEAFDVGIAKLEEALRSNGSIHCVFEYDLLWGSKP